jgi:hypothetical protein
MDWPKWRDTSIELMVNFSEEKSSWNIKCYAAGQAVCGSDLGVVMDEVYHRLGYEHREQGRIETSMAAALKLKFPLPREVKGSRMHPI